MSEAQRFGRYTVTGTLGSGGMGHVYAAVDDVLGRPVAVKTLRGGATGEGARQLDERFRIEARAVAALSHPGIVQVYDLDLAADPPYLVMERMAGPSLKELFARGPMPASELRALGIQIARALAAAHAAGIVHRDVKPANILVAGPGVWKLADFGVAHVPDSSLTITGQFIGSPAYAPPEALLRGQSTPAGDVFGLGATLYYGAAGIWPRAEASTGLLLAPVPSIRTLVPDLPADLIAAIDRAIEIEPARRPTAADLADAFAGAGLRPATPPPDTQFVPDATVDMMPPRRRGGAGAGGAGAEAPSVAAPAPLATAFVADSTSPALAQASPAAPPRSKRRKVWAIAAVALGLLIVVAAATSTSQPTATVGGSPVVAPPPWVPAPASSSSSLPASSPPSSPSASPEPDTGAANAPGEPALEPPPPGEIRAVTPPINNRRAAEEWRKVVDKLYDHDFRKARQKLVEWERRWGSTAETRSLLQQLDALPAEASRDD